jgi:hypothetical protein
LQALRRYAPRPAVDIAGRATIGYLCAQLALAQTNSLASYGLFTGVTPQIFAVVGVVAGALGWVRRLILNPARARAPLVVFG